MMDVPPLLDSPSSPATRIPTDPAEQTPEEGIALCLSGGGYRAMLFHVGALWRLNELGYLPKLDRVSSVSGGSITAGVLGLAWSRLDFQGDVARGFNKEVVDPIRRLAGKTIDIPAVLLGLLLPGSVSDRIAGAYRRHLFGRSDLQALPDKPRFVFNASNIQSGALWRFSKPYMADWRVGMIPNPKVEVAVAVGASSAFPPFLSPTVLHFKESDYIPLKGTDLHEPPFTTDVYLTDGGVYDNLGLETVWKQYRTVLVSDGGGQMSPEKKPSTDWARHVLRVLTLVDNQVRARRKIQVVGSYLAAEDDPEHREGAYWSSWTDITEYRAPGALPCPHEKTLKLAAVPTRLGSLNARTQEQLINWGYAVCDAAMRSYGKVQAPAPVGFPYPKVGVG